VGWFFNVCCRSKHFLTLLREGPGQMAHMLFSWRIVLASQFVLCQSSSRASMVERIPVVSRILRRRQFGRLASH
jgi:hypothetical protein